jgi:hypothetical protein
MDRPKFTMLFFIKTMNKIKSIALAMVFIFEAGLMKNSEKIGLSMIYIWYKQQKQFNYEKVI